MKSSTELEHSKSELVVLLDESGTPIGEANKLSVHGLATPLHLAFSCHVYDPAGRVLVTRRALTKLTWPGVWTNTACGHPALDESFPDAIARRVDYELGMAVRDIEVVLPEHLYRAPAYRGIVEYEFCPVFVARQASAPQPNAIEVGACAWIDWDEFVRRTREDTSDVYSWWCKNQLSELVGNPLVERYARPAGGVTRP